jgi:hypothetical protein
MLFSEMGFDAVFFGRIDESEKNFRMQGKTLQFVTKPFA